MPLTTTATWPTLNEGRKAKASEVEAKFDWLEGAQYPMTGGNMTTGVYDIGAPAYRWRYGYFTTVYADNLVTTSTITSEELRTTYKAWAWAVASVGTVTAGYSYNISSIALLATGTYRIYWTVPFANNTYSVVSMPRVNLAWIGTADNFTTTSVDLFFFTAAAGLATPTSFDIMATGDQ